MRILLMLPLVALASPALAQSAPPPPYDHAPPPYEMPALPPQLFDPAMPAQLGRMAGALTRVFMNLPVGELEAAIEGRPPSPSDRRKTVGNTVRRDYPSIERDIQRDVASSAGAMQSGARAMQRAMPVIGQAIGRAAAEIERATANMPSPYYPVR